MVVELIATARGKHKNENEQRPDHSSPSGIQRAAIAIRIARKRNGSGLSIV
jgi:hypothetical protein